MIPTGKEYPSGKHRLFIPSQNKKYLIGLFSTSLVKFVKKYPFGIIPVIYSDTINMMVQLVKNTRLVSTN